MAETEKPDTTETLCRLYKYYKQHTNPYITYPISCEKIKTLSFYKTNKKVFDKLSSLVEKYGICPDGFIKYCVLEMRVSKPKEMLNTQVFINYANKLKVDKQYKKIYSNFLKTANYIADVCISENITPKDYIKMLIKERRLGIEYMCGHISTHFIASINGIKKIFKCLDQNTRDELSIIYDAAEKLNGDIQEAFMRYKSHRVSPFKFTELLIKQKREQNKQLKTTN
jgi:hypothetical protein